MKRNGKNMYLLEKEKKKSRGKLRIGMNIFFRCGAVMAFVMFIGVWAGMECGPLMLGRRMIASVFLVIMAAASVAGEYATHCRLPLDEGGEDDESL